LASAVGVQAPVTVFFPLSPVGRDWLQSTILDVVCSFDNSARRISKAGPILSLYLERRLEMQRETRHEAALYRIDWSRSWWTLGMLDLVALLQGTAQLPERNVRGTFPQLAGSIRLSPPRESTSSAVTQDSVEPQGSLTWFLYNVHR
jgi:hypothetical protein